MTEQNRFSGIIGDDYDLFKMAVPHHDELQDTLADMIKAYAATRHTSSEIQVLEIGCGTGETTRRILAADPRITVTAVDNDEHMLKTARQNLLDYRERACFKSNLINAIAPLGKTFWGGGWIDVVASAYTIHNFDYEYRSRVSAIIASQLREGGLFVNADKYASDDAVIHWNELREQIDAFAVFDTINRHDLRVEWTTHYLEDEKTKMFESDEKNRLAKFNFAGIKTVYRKGMEAVIVATKK